MSTEYNYVNANCYNEIIIFLFLFLFHKIIQTNYRVSDPQNYPDEKTIVHLMKRRMTGFCFHLQLPNLFLAHLTIC